MPADILAVAARLREAREPFVLATVVASYKPQSVRAGAKAVVRADGSLEGWIGGGCVRPAVLQEARAALEDGRPRLVRLNVEAEDGAAPHPVYEGICVYPMTCQGEGGLEVYLEPVLPAPRLAVLGGTPVALALARLGAEVGFAVVIAAPGLAAAEAAALLPRDATVAAGAAAAVAGLGAGDAVVVATMGAGDEDALAAAATSGAGYVGLVASRKKGAFLLDDARANGVPAERLARVKAPAGLDLGGMQGPEIALSVLAEIVARRHRRAVTLGAGAVAPAPGVRAPEGAYEPAPSAPVAAAPASPAAAPRRGRSLALAPLPIDPVCGMPVDPATAAHTLVVGGETVYFCCPRCKAAYGAGSP